jgi:hypothetical protein
MLVATAVFREVVVEIDSTRSYRFELLYSTRGD